MPRTITAPTGAELRTVEDLLVLAHHAFPQSREGFAGIHLGRPGEGNTTVPVGNDAAAARKFTTWFHALLRDLHPDAFAWHETTCLTSTLAIRVWIEEPSAHERICAIERLTRFLHDRGVCADVIEEEIVHRGWGPAPVSWLHPLEGMPG